MAILPIHSALQNPDIAGNFQQGLKFGTAQRLQRQAEQEQQQLRDLAPAIQSGDPAAFGQAAVISPEYASAQQSVGDGGIRRLKGAITFIEQAQKTGNPRAVEAAYQQVRPYLARFGQEPPATFAEAEPKFMEAKARIAMLDSTPKEMPSGFQQFKLTAEAAGLIPGSPEYQQAARIALGQEGRASTSGFSQVKFTDASGRERIGVLNGRTGQIDLPDGTSFNPQTGAISEGQSMASPMPSMSANPQQDYSALAQEFPGAVITSTMRTQQRNQEVGGVPNSQHLRGTAADFVVPQQNRQAFIQRARQMGYEAIDEGDHVHLELPPNQQIAGRAALGIDPFAGRRKEDEAAAVTSAQEAAKLQYLPESERIKTEAAISQAAGTAAAKGEAEARLEARQNLPRVIQESNNTIGLIDMALNHPGRATATGASSRLDPRNFVPGTDARDFQVLLDQIKGGTFLQAFQSLKGGGAITETEGRKAEQAIARLDTAQSEEAFVQSLQELRQIAQDAIGRAERKAQGGQAPAQRGRQVVRTGTLNGRRVVQYSDGTTDYAD